MKIAVVGAGMAGTTCAEELHRLGHEVEVFEMSAPDKPTRPRQMEGCANFLGNVPEIETDHTMKRIEINSPNVAASLKGKLGFFYEVGGTNGIEAKSRKRIEKLLPVHYSRKIETKNQLQDKFQIIVAADGYPSNIAKEAGLVVSSSPRRVGTGVGFTVKGEFDPECMEIWFDSRFSLHGYSYIIPFSKYEASLISASVGQSIDHAAYRQQLKVLSELRKWEIQNGWVDFERWYDFQTYAKDKLYVIGNAGSFTDPALGFGLKWAVKSAKLCAKAIHENIDYSQLIQKEIIPDFKPFQTLRQFFETTENKDYDEFVKSFKNPLVKALAATGKSLVGIYVRKLNFKE